MTSGLMTAQWTINIFTMDKSVGVTLELFNYILQHGTPVPENDR